MITGPSNDSHLYSWLGARYCHVPLLHRLLTCFWDDLHLVVVMVVMMMVVVVVMLVMVKMMVVVVTMVIVKMKIYRSLALLLNDGTSCGRLEHWTQHCLG